MLETKRNDSTLHVVVGRWCCASVFVFAVASHSEGAHRFTSITRFELRSSTSLAHKACLCLLTFLQFVVTANIFRSLLPFHSRQCTSAAIEVYLFVSCSWCSAHSAESGYVISALFLYSPVDTQTHSPLWEHTFHVIRHHVWRHAIARRANDDMTTKIAFGKTW